MRVKQQNFADLCNQKLQSLIAQSGVEYDKCSGLSLVIALEVKLYETHKFFENYRSTLAWVIFLRIFMKEIKFDLKW